MQRDADRDMRYVKSYKEDARSAVVGESKSLEKRDREVDSWGILMTRTTHSFSPKMSFLSEVRTQIAIEIFFLLSKDL